MGWLRKGGHWCGRILRPMCPIGWPSQPLSSANQINGSQSSEKQKPCPLCYLLDTLFYLQILWGQQRLAPSSGAGHISEISRNHTEIWQLLGWCLTNQCTFSWLRKKKCKRAVSLNVSSIFMFQDYKDKPCKRWIYFISSRIDGHTSKFRIQLLLPVCTLVLDLI